MKLKFLDTVLNPDKEHELFPTDKNKGFKVTIKFSDLGNYNGVTNIYNNVTEVHHLYNKGERTAIESDIHSTGCTYLVTDIDSVVIDLADKVENDF